MNIVPLSTQDRVRWNTFVCANFPPVGAFLQSYEWSDFKEALHGKVVRFAIEEGGEWIACFHIEIHSLPFSFSYGYAPRGPVLRKDLYTNKKKLEEVFSYIGTYLKEHFSHLIFVRFEPPLKDIFSCDNSKLFARPSYYVQPRFNQLITIASPEEMLKTFSTDIKHDIRAAERMEITVIHTPVLSQKESDAYEAMKNDTRIRSQKSIFPSENYFAHFLKLFRADADTSGPRLLYFIACNKAGEPVAMNLNLLYAHTLTYLYGASYTGSASKRAPAYLHWKTMDYARENGFEYYDLGGVDEAHWHGLTYFKRQFGGETLEYMGVIDIVLKPTLYAFYNKIKGSNLRKLIQK